VNAERRGVRLPFFFQLSLAAGRVGKKAAAHKS
jgi:hypothetical protein